MILIFVFYFDSFNQNQKKKKIKIIYLLFPTEVSDIILSSYFQLLHGNIMMFSWTGIEVTSSFTSKLPEKQNLVNAVSVCSKLVLRAVDTRPKEIILSFTYLCYSW